MSFFSFAEERVNSQASSSSKHTSIHDEPHTPRRNAVPGHSYANLTPCSVQMKGSNEYEYSTGEVSNDSFILGNSKADIKIAKFD